MSPLVVLNCVGLTPGHLGEHTPHLNEIAARGFVAPLEASLPAVTATAQATMLTGYDPSKHGIVANGWYFRDLNEILFGRQSERLMEVPPVWEGKPWKVLKHFWWYAMNTSAAATVTPRPVYHHDGSKSPDFYAWPPELKEVLLSKHGDFPLFHFWGPTASIESTRWIARSFCSAWHHQKPDLGLCYLPHLDYDLQRLGPEGAHLGGNLKALDECVGVILKGLAQYSPRFLVVSEYGLVPVRDAVFPNRFLRAQGYLKPTWNAAGELMDLGMSRAFAVCDHQIAHVYVKSPKDVASVRRCLEKVPGIAAVLEGCQRAELGLDHHRSGELVLVSEADQWFAFDYWETDSKKPDFAKCVEIHKKPGYDPRELFFDPNGGRLRAAKALFRKKLGLRYVLDPCSLDARLVRGSHGISVPDPNAGPVFIASEKSWDSVKPRHHRDVARVIRFAMEGQS
jgi:predicted AlkP superfamily pyrophosphatase or phosphodiesterase